MANENQSRENQSRQQTSERSQTGSAQQGTGAARGTSQGNYGQRASGQGGSAQGSPETGASTWQGGHQQPGGALRSRGGTSSMTPYSSASSGYGGGPFSVMRRITDEMDRLFENFGMGRSLFPGGWSQGGSWDTGSFGGTGASMWSPHIDVCERNGKMLIQADLPGMKRDDVHVRIEQDEVIIQGERRQEASNQQGGYYRSERSYGSFYRTIPLPEGTNTDSATATFRDGVLEIELDAPRHQQQGRTLEIRDATGSPGGSHAGTGSGATYGGQQSSGTNASQHSASGTSSKGSNT
ncbi:MAG TPA: Hsp20/alpha crystallin family protein [Casimicrobiaceae bacterium]|nr:Hsp20/alpha crystallin family protein [Casimicrobiaceae bacterium]